MASLSPGQLSFLIIAGLVSGAVNAVAGGGSLLVFPALLAVGLPALDANVTNSVAQWPGYVGVTVGARRELVGQGRRVLTTTAVAIPGAATGCALLLILPKSVFDTVVPWLVLLATIVFALSRRFKRWIGDPLGHAGGGGAHGRDRNAVLLPSIFLAAIYGGYFGGALGVILLSVLSLFAHDRLARLNAVKAVLSLIVATVTVLIFSVGAPVHWWDVALLAPATLVGGYLGARLASVLPEPVLRWAVVLLGLAVAAYLFLNPS